MYLDGELSNIKWTRRKNEFFFDQIKWFWNWFLQNTFNEWRVLRNIKGTVWFARFFISHFLFEHVAERSKEEQFRKMDDNLLNLQKSESNCVINTFSRWRFIFISPISMNQTLSYWKLFFEVKFTQIHENCWSNFYDFNSSNFEQL